MIPDTITSLYYTFSGCSSLVVAPEIPNSVTEIRGVFNECSSLVEAPVIPSSVKKMSHAFGGCSAITGNIVINANPNSWYIESWLTGVNKENISLGGTSGMLKKLYNEIK